MAGMSGLYLEDLSIAQRTVLGFAVPGTPYRTDETIDAVGQCDQDRHGSYAASLRQMGPLLVLYGDSILRVPIRFAFASSHHHASGNPVRNLGSPSGWPNLSQYTARGPEIAMTGM
jgi:hypothetical protein